VLGRGRSDAVPVVPDWSVVTTGSVVMARSRLGSEAMNDCADQASRLT
jgi:hypothetical protein